MAFSFEDLSPSAKKAAFAHMDAKRLGKGGRHKKLSAKQKGAVEHGGRGKVSGKLGSGSVKGQLSPADSDSGAVRGKLPIAKARQTAPKPDAAAKPAANTADAHLDKAVASDIKELTGGKTHQYAGLVDLRKKLDARGISRQAQDKHLKRMSSERKVSIVPEDNRKALRQEDHDAAIRIGGDDNHLISLLDGDPNSAPTPVKPLPSTDVNKLAAMTDHDDLAKKYLMMHGDAGVSKKITQLEGRKRLRPGDRAMLAALKALQKKPKQATPEWPS